MSPEDGEELTEFLRDRVDEYLRGVVFYDADEYAVEYVRPDLDRSDLVPKVERMIEHVIRESRVRETRAFPFGDLQGTVKSFERAVVVHFPLAQERGVVVTLHPDAALQLNAFMEECVRRL